MGTRIEAPPPQNYGNMMADTLLAQAEMESGTGRFSKIGPRIDLERKYGPQYEQLQIESLQRSLPKLLELYNSQIAPSLANAENQSRMIARTGDIQSIEQLGGRARAALASANPYQAKLVNSMTMQAQSAVDAGSMLTPDQKRAIEQDVRASFAARGLAFSPGSSVSEIVRGQLAGAGMQQQRQNMAAQALGAGQSFYGDTFQQILGRPSQSFSASGSLIGQAQGFNPGAIFNPESALAANISNNNYQGQLAANTATASNRSGLIGGGIGAFGSIMGGWLGK